MLSVLWDINHCQKICVGALVLSYETQNQVSVVQQGHMTLDHSFLILMQISLNYTHTHTHAEVFSMLGSCNDESVHWFQT